MQALLAEVHQLRLALQQSAAVAPKIQVTLQRLQLQQDQVTRSSRQLEEFRNQKTHQSSELAQLAAERKDVESRSAQEQDPASRKVMEEQLKNLTVRYEQGVAHLKVQEAEQQQREMELEARLRAEQGKLDELNGRLDTLDRMLELPQPK